ncbi:MAG: hypothetical protein NC217_02670 [Muribaculaceae bacterium]|nr:hypothetical protein [Muribaculaceae bacterium]
MRKLTTLAAVTLCAFGALAQSSNSNLTADPADGSTVTSLASVIVKSATSSPLWDRGSGEIVVKKDGTAFSTVSCRDNGNDSFTIKLDTEATKAGVYTIEAEEGAFEYENGSSVDAFTLTYTIEGSAQTAKASLNINPEPGTLTTPLTSFSITSGVEEYPAIEINSVDDIRVLKNGEDFCSVKRDNSARTMTFNLKETVTESAQYTVVFPADSYYLYKYVDEENIEELSGVEQKFVYDVEIGGPKFNIEIPETKLNPNSIDPEDASLVDPYDLKGGELTEFSLTNLAGAYFATEGATVHVYNKRAQYDVQAVVTADAPKKAITGNNMTTTVHFTLPQPITTDGTYTLEIPKGIFGDEDYHNNSNSGTANKAYTWTVAFTGGLPEPGPSVKYDLGLKGCKPAEGMVDMDSYTWEVTSIMIDAAYDLAPNSTKQASLVCETADYNQSGIIRLSMADMSTRTLRFNNSRQPSNTGTYVLTIPEATFGDAEWIEDPETGHTNPEIKVYFLVQANGAITTEYDIEVASVTPANDATVTISEETPVTISFTANGEYGYLPVYKVGVACEAAEYDGTAAITSAETAEGVTTFTLALDKAITVNGEYTLTFPEGLFGDADYIANWSTGHASKAFTSVFTVSGGGDQPEPAKYDLTYTVTPENDAQLPINEAVFVTIVFPEGTVPTADSPRASLKSTEANYFLTVLFQKGEQDGTYTLNFATAPKREGTYTISLAEGMFFNAGLNSYSPAIDLTFHVVDTGVDSVLNDEAVEGGIYDLNGVYVGDKLNELPAGIYVMKGHKVIVKK